VNEVFRIEGKIKRWADINGVNGLIASVDPVYAVIALIIIGKPECLIQFFTRIGAYGVVITGRINEVVHIYRITRKRLVYSSLCSLSYAFYASIFKGVN
jgi:hypothetical protein